MVTIAQRIEKLRTEKGISRPALAAAVGFPRMAIEKFETGRQTPTQDQQQKLCDYFGVTLAYLRGESDTPSGTGSWFNGELPEEEPVAAPKMPVRTVAAQSSSGAKDDGAVFSALLRSESFRALVRESVVEALKSREGQELLANAVRKQLK